MELDWWMWMALGSIITIIAGLFFEYPLRFIAAALNLTVRKQKVVAFEEREKELAERKEAKEEK